MRSIIRAAKRAEARIDRALGRVAGRARSRVSKAARAYVQKKIRKLALEGYPPKQRVAIALAMARAEGYDVPRKGAK